MQSWADCITGTNVSSFWKRQAANVLIRPIFVGKPICKLDKFLSRASPWQNGLAERLIGSIRRECVDHIVVLGEAHLRRICKLTPVITITSERTGH